MIGFKDPCFDLLHGESILDENVIPMHFVQVVGSTYGFISIAQLLSFLWCQLNGNAGLGIFQWQMQEYFIKKIVI